MNLDNLQIGGETNKNEMLTQSQKEKNEKTLIEDPQEKPTKKVRIPKLKKNLGGKSSKVSRDEFRKIAKNHMKDRLHQLKQDKKELEKLRKASSEKEKIDEFIDDRIASIVEEEKKLREKLKYLKEGKTIYPESDERQKITSGLSLKKITGYGILLFIMGLTLIYISSEYGLLAFYGILLITGSVFALVMSILGIF